jgi:hypothetical protein
MHEALSTAESSASISRHSECLAHNLKTTNNRVMQTLDGASDADGPHGSLTTPAGTDEHDAGLPL